MSPIHRPRDPWSEPELVALFATLPRLAPSELFVDRVMAGLPGLRRRSLFESRWTKAAIAAALVGVAVSAALVVPTVLSLLRVAGPATLLSYWISAVGDLCHGLGASVGAWDRLASFARALGKAFAEPRALLVLTAQVALAAAAFRGLLALSPRRSSTHVALVP